MGASKKILLNTGFGLKLARLRKVKIWFMGEIQSVYGSVWVDLLARKERYQQKYNNKCKFGR